MSIFPSLACPKLVLTFYFALVTLLEDVTKTGNGERGTGNGKWEMRNRERESGNECTAVTRLRIQHGGQRKRKGNNLGEM